MLRLLTSLALLGAFGCSLSLPIGRAFPLDGRQVYERSCASCHGVGGRGDGPVASSLRDRPADLTALAATAGGRFPRERVIATVLGDRTVVAHGPNSMPVWSDRFAPTGWAGTTVASVYGRRHAEVVAEYLESLQVSVESGAAP